MAQTTRRQVERFNARERRLAIGSARGLFRTHKIDGGTVIEVATVDTDVLFPSRGEPITFAASIEVVGATPTGLVFELGSSAIGAALWLNDTEILFHAGSSGTVDGATATFDNTVSLPVGLRSDIVVAAIPGDGRVRMWSNGIELARSVASGGEFASDWAAAGDGSFASAVNGTTVSPVTGAPSGFDVVSPLSAYVNQVPRDFV